MTAEQLQSLTKSLNEKFRGTLVPEDLDLSVSLNDVESESLGCTLLELAEFLIQEGRERAAKVIEEEAGEYEKQYGPNGRGGATAGVLFHAAQMIRERA